MLDLLIKRRSIRKYKKMDVEQEKVDTLIKAALLSPSSKNRQPWELVVVTDKGILKELSRSKKKGIQFIEDAPLAIVVLGDENISDVWIEDTAIVSTIIQLTAESIGLGSCWSQVRNRPHDEEKAAERYVQELLDIPNNKRVECIIGIGYPDESLTPHNIEDLRYDKVLINKYSIKWYNVCNKSY